MAIVYPDIEKIKQFKVAPQEGELYLLNVLKDNLDDSFEIYFNPYLNGDRPDVVIVREGYGVYIIEVKDWHFQHYELTTKKHWQLRKNGAITKSPIDQALQYKENLYVLHIDKLLEKKLKNFLYWKVVNCGVYFHNETNNSINSLLVEPFIQDKKYNDFLKYNVDLIGRDDLHKNKLLEILKNRYLLSVRPSSLFDKELYDSFSRLLKPSHHLLEQGESINYSKEQIDLIISTPRNQRIKGVVGSGKTTVLAARSVAAVTRTNEDVLILTYNVTLKNYIHDKISRVRSDFSWGHFHITNYHNFIRTELNNLGIAMLIPEDFTSYSEEAKSIFFEDNYFSNYDLFSSKSSEIQKYKTIFIDEIQDYKRTWMDIIKDFYLEEGGEYVIFGDVKQNIYANEIEERDISTNVKGKPTTLTRNFRSNQKVNELSVAFQKTFFGNKYEIDDFDKQHSLFDSKSKIEYEFISNGTSLLNIAKYIVENSKRLNENLNDITILGVRIDILKKLDLLYRLMTKQKTNQMFETDEMFNRIRLGQLSNKSECIMEALALFNSKAPDTDKLNKLAVLISYYKISKEIPVSFLDESFAQHLIVHNIEKPVFESWYKKYENTLKTDFNRSDILKIRDNKKFNFWFNSGTVKLSTIHSFKGWETNTLFVIVEPFFSTSDFPLSFDEIIYTSLTRSKTNIFIINYGNTEFDLSMKNFIKQINN